MPGTPSSPPATGPLILLRSWLLGLLGRRSVAPPLPPAPAGIPYSSAGSEPIAVPVDMVGRAAEQAALTELLGERRVVFLHGPARMGKTYVALGAAAANLGTVGGRPFLYTCPADLGIGTLYGRLGRFFRANGYDGFAEQAGLPETNDDDRSRMLGEQLARDRYLIVLDAFKQVAHRAPFRALVRACCREDGEGRLLLCTRELPPWYGDLPTATVGALALGGLAPADQQALALSRGYTGAELAGSGRPLHPFLLQLVLYLARQQDVSPGSLLARIPERDQESVLLEAICAGLPAEHVVARLSVLRGAFRPAALKAFGEAEEALGELPLSLLVESGGQGLTLHPLARTYGRARLDPDPGACRLAHEQALVWYQSGIAETGKQGVQACLESAWHLLELARPREALEVLLQHHRRIVSWGYGGDLLAAVRRLEGLGIANPEDEAAAAGARADLAAIYVRLPVANVAENHLRAIRYAGQAVDHYAENGPRVLQAGAHNVLGMACSRLPLSDLRRNVQRALESYEQALALYRQLGLAEGRAVVHNNLGGAWMRLASLGGEWCIQRAHSHLQQAVRSYAHGIDPYTRALVEANLGNVLCQLGRVEEGLEHFREALAHFRREVLPCEYADTQRRLGDAHRLAASGGRPSRLARALGYYAEALTVYEEEVFPEDFAATQHLLGVVHRQLARYQEAPRHRRLAVRCYENALRVYTPETFPHQHRQTTTNLQRDLAELGEEAE